MCQLLRIHSVHMYPDLVLKYTMSLTLVQTNCTKPTQGSLCVPQPYTPSVLVSVLLEVVPWFGIKEVVSVKIKLHNCSAVIATEHTLMRDCSQYVPPVQVYALRNVSL